MRRANSLEKTLMLGKIEGRRRRGWQRTRWLDGIINSMDMSLSKLQEMVKDRRAWSPWGRKELDTTEWLKNNSTTGRATQQTGEQFHQRSYHTGRHSRDHSRFPTLETGQRGWVFPGNLTLKASGLWLRNFHRTGETRLLEGTNKTVCAPELRREGKWSHKNPS